MIRPSKICTSRKKNMMSIQIMRSFFFCRRHVVSCLLLSSDQIIQKSSPVQQPRCRDGVSFRFRIWRLFDLSWWNRRCHVLLMNSQDVSLIRRDVLYTCETICRLRSSYLSKDERRICAQLEVCNRWCYCLLCSFFICFGSPVVRNSSEGIFSALSVISKLFSWQFCNQFLMLVNVIDLTYRTLLQRNMQIIRTRKIRIISKKKFEELSIDFLRASQKCISSHDINQWYWMDDSNHKYNLNICVILCN